MSTKPVKANTRYEPISFRTASEADVTAEIYRKYELKIHLEQILIPKNEIIQ